MTFPPLREADNPVYPLSMWKRKVTVHLRIDLPRIRSARRYCNGANPGKIPTMNGDESSLHDGS